MAFRSSVGLRVSPKGGGQTSALEAKSGVCDDALDVRHISDSALSKVGPGGSPGAILEKRGSGRHSAALCR